MNLQAELRKHELALTSHLEETRLAGLRAFARDLLLEAAKRTCEDCRLAGESGGRIVFRTKNQDSKYPDSWYHDMGNRGDYPCEAGRIHALLAELEAEEGG